MIYSTAHTPVVHNCELVFNILQASFVLRCSKGSSEFLL